MIVTCKMNCEFQKEGFCEKDVVSINPFGQCDKWWDSRGNPTTLINLLTGQRIPNPQAAFDIIDLEMEEK